MLWNKLSMADRAKYIQMAVASGITDLSGIHRAYETYADGGYLDGMNADSPSTFNVYAEGGDTQSNTDNQQELEDTEKTREFLSNWLNQREDQFSDNLDDFFAQDKYKGNLSSRELQAIAPTPVLFRPFLRLFGLDAAQVAMQKQLDEMNNTKVIDFRGVNQITGREDPLDKAFRMKWPRTTGMYYPDSKTIRLAKNIEDVPGSTNVHEHTHALTHKYPIQEAAIDKIFQDNGIDTSKPYTTDTEGYFDNPDEVYSRLMDFRRTAGLDPKKIITKKDIENFRRNYPDNHEFLNRYSDEVLLRLFNDVAYNKPTKDYSTYNENTAALGGILDISKNIFDDGGDTESDTDSPIELPSITDYMAHPIDSVKRQIAAYMLNAIASGKNIDEVRQILYDKVMPQDYEFNIVDTYNRIKEAFKDGAPTVIHADRDDIWAEYLQIPQERRHSTIYGYRNGEIPLVTPSPYRPTVSNSSNMEYKRVNLPDIYKKAFVTSAFTEIPAYKEMPGIEGTPRYELGYSELPSIGESKVSNALATFFGPHTISRGFDPDRGEYVSYYDKWDLAPISSRSNKEDETFGIGKPIEFYDRIYLDDYYEVPEELRFINRNRDEDTYYGGYLAPMTVTPYYAHRTSPLEDFMNKKH